MTVLLCEFKEDVTSYLRERTDPEVVACRDLADLIRFNEEHREEEMKYFGQELFEKAQVGNFFVAKKTPVCKNSPCKIIKIPCDI